MRISETKLIFVLSFVKWLEILFCIWLSTFLIWMFLRNSSVFPFIWNWTILISMILRSIYLINRIKNCNFVYLEVLTFLRPDCTLTLLMFWSHTWANISIQIRTTWFIQLSWTTFFLNSSVLFRITKLIYSNTVWNRFWRETSFFI